MVPWHCVSIYRALVVSVSLYSWCHYYKYHFLSSRQDGLNYKNRRKIRLHPFTITYHNSVTSDEKELYQIMFLFHDKNSDSKQKAIIGNTSTYQSGIDQYNTYIIKIYAEE